MQMNSTEDSTRVFARIRCEARSNPDIVNIPTVVDREKCHEEVELKWLRIRVKRARDTRVSWCRPPRT
jgi:hypothetical protein